MDEFESLAAFEQHCYWNRGPNARQDQESHRARLLQLIERDSQKSLENLRREKDKEVTQAIRHKHESRITGERTTATQ